MKWPPVPKTDSAPLRPLMESSMKSLDDPFTEAELEAEEYVVYHHPPSKTAHVYIPAMHRARMAKEIRRLRTLLLNMVEED